MSPRSRGWSGEQGPRLAQRVVVPAIVCNRYYQVLVDLLATGAHGVQVAFPHGGAADWEFTPAMKAVAPDPGDQWKGYLGKWLANRNKAMYV